MRYIEGVMTKKNSVTSKRICELLEERFYSSQKHMIAFEVANGTGGAADRRADAVSMEFWPSNGMEIVGYEIKVSRSDWLNELKQPDKSLAISKFCDKWYLVAPSGILRPDELPKGWGFMQAGPNSLRTTIKAPKREPIDPDRFFMASLIRSIRNRYNNEDLLQEKYASLAESAQEMAKRDSQRDINRLELEIYDAKETAKSFEEKSGIRLDKYSVGRISEVVKLLHSRENVSMMANRIKSEISNRNELNELGKKSLDIIKNIISNKEN